jgi:anti-sigma B factor antagonist
MTLYLETEELGEGRYVIALAGEVDLYTSPELKEELARIIEQGPAHVVIDLTATTFIDSTALGVLIRGVDQLRARGQGRLSVVCTDRDINRIFEVTGLDRVFEVYASRADALHEAPLI